MVREAGSILARFHQIKLASFGWVTAGSVERSHAQWKEFLEEDFTEKERRLTVLSPKQRKTIHQTFCNYLKHVPEGKPVLLHKDYHGSHILCNKKKVTGIIDIEWAIAGRPGLDFVKPNWWMFEDYPQLKKPFYEGYAAVSKIKVSAAEERFYELYTAVSLLSFSVQQGTWLSKNKNRLLKVISLHSKK